MSEVSVVWVTHEAAATPRTGGSLRSAHLIAALAERARVDVVSLNPVDADAYRALTGAREVLVAPAVARSRTAAKLAGWARGQPGLFADSRHREARRFVAARVASGAVVVLEHLRTLPFRPRGSWCVLALQNVDSDLIGTVDEDSPGWRRLTARIDRLLARRAERRAAKDPRVLVTVVSDLDATRLGGSPLIVPNGVTIPSDVPGLPATGPVLFVGSMTYSPNREAVRWWVDDVWPLRPPGLPPLTVVGRRADTELRDLSGHPAVALGGEIADLGPLMASAAVVAIPVISGGGTRLKVLEAMAWGRPVVTTSKGAEGLPIVSGQHARVADDPASFGSAVMHLLDDRQDAAQLARSGRLLAESAYSWTTIGPAFADAVLRHGMRQG